MQFKLFISKNKSVDLHGVLVKLQTKEQQIKMDILVKTDLKDIVWQINNVPQQFHLLKQM